MEQQTKELRSIENLLRIMLKEDGKIDVSFVSKLIATINSKLSIWDKFVLINLDKTTPWKKLQPTDEENIDFLL